MYNRKKPIEEIPEENTKIWTCESEGCNSWMRDNFAFDHVPTCLVCHTPMVSGERMLPVLVNTTGEMKSLKKGAPAV
ncbi:cold-shock protein [Paenibacillus arenilitoris]|uniref:Cold-shock protein n=1 Tax=Paenibacillus arenilitoris TaxID=2772299 RepID=A0A927CLV0_9BACL|nr:cold-shock protein [Paenibacillus arenilitoris]MBD2868226.1 cold-shock protein [Paenibacillus arenilitoris]